MFLDCPRGYRGSVMSAGCAGLGVRCSYGPDAHSSEIGSTGNNTQERQIDVEQHQPLSFTLGPGLRYQHGAQPYDEE